MEKRWGEGRNRDGAVVGMGQGKEQGWSRGWSKDGDGAGKEEGWGCRRDGEETAGVGSALGWEGDGDGNEERVRMGMGKGQECSREGWSKDGVGAEKE